MSAYTWSPIDFYFDFSQTNVNAGGTATTGASANYYWRGENTQSSSAYVLDNESIGEISGIEVFGPFTGNYREKLKYIRPVINGLELATLSMNELMSPGLTGGQPDPLGSPQVGMRYGHACINYGMPVLAGGHPVEGTPKIGPGESLSFKVAANTAAEGGTATLNTLMIVRAWIARVKGQTKLQNILNYYHGRPEANNGLFNGQYLDCGFDLGDLETMDVMPIQHFDKQVGNSNGFQLSDWTELPGGNDCTKPKSTSFCTYGQNIAATTTNMWYQMTQDGSHVSEDWNVLKWNYGKKTALKLTHVGVLPHPNIRYLNLYRSNRSIPTIYQVQMQQNSLPLPAGRFTNELVYQGPMKLPRSFLVWNEIGSLEVMDNGTSIPAWAATNTGFQVAVWGEKFDLD